MEFGRLFTAGAGVEEPAEVDDREGGLVGLSNGVGGEFRTEVAGRDVGDDGSEGLDVVHRNRGCHVHEAHFCGHLVSAACDFAEFFR